MVLVESNKWGLGSQVGVLVRYTATQLQKYNKVFKNTWW